MHVMSVISFYSIIIHVYTQAMESGCIKQQNTVTVITVIMGAEKLTFAKWRYQQKISSSYTSTGQESWVIRLRCNDYFMICGV